MAISAPADLIKAELRLCSKRFLASCQRYLKHRNLPESLAFQAGVCNRLQHIYSPMDVNTKSVYRFKKWLHIHAEIGRDSRRCDPKLSTHLGAGDANSFSHPHPACVIPGAHFYSFPVGNVTQSAKSHEAAEFGLSWTHKGLVHCVPNPWACGDSHPKTTYQISTKAIFTWKRSCCSLLMTRDRLLAVSESQLFDLLILKEYEIQDCC